MSTCGMGKFEQPNRETGHSKLDILCSQKWMKNYFEVMNKSTVNFYQWLVARMLTEGDFESIDETDLENILQILFQSEEKKLTTFTFWRWTELNYAKK